MTGEIRSCDGVSGVVRAKVTVEGAADRHLVTFPGGRDRAGDTLGPASVRTVVWRMKYAARSVLPERAREALRGLTGRG